MNYSVVIAGSTSRTRLCAESLFSDPRVLITGILTPTPKAVGRKKLVTPNSLHQFALEHQIPTLLIERKIDTTVQAKIKTLPAPQILLVVDFGYIVPQWLLDWPSVAPVNVHPSDLPKYRGSSPGQFALLFGEKDSAVSIMVMDKELDHGPIMIKLPFSIDPTWTASDYYEQAFRLVSRQLADILEKFSKDPTKLLPQPDESPTPIARQLTRADGFVPLEILQSVIKGTRASNLRFLSAYGLSTTASSLFNLWRGFTPWPGIWTLIDLHGTQKRMKLLSMHLENGQLTLGDVQIEGRVAQSFSSVQIPI